MKKAIVVISVLLLVVGLAQCVLPSTSPAPGTSTSEPAVTGSSGKSSGPIVPPPNLSTTAAPTLEPSTAPIAAPSESIPAQNGPTSDATPEQPASTSCTESELSSPDSAPTEPTENPVWISRTGSKYHTNSNCSNMKNPSQISREEAEAQGYAPCKRCC